MIECHFQIKQIKLFVHTKATSVSRILIFKIKCQVKHLIDNILKEYVI